MTSRDLYGLYRQVADLRNTLKESDEFFHLTDAINLAEKLEDELFKVVGELAAFEIDNEYWDKKDNNTD